MTSLLAAKGVGPVAIVNRYLPQIDLWLGPQVQRPDSETLQALSTFVSRGLGSGFFAACKGLFPFMSVDTDLKCYSLNDPTMRLLPYNSTGLVPAPDYGITGLPGQSFYYEGETNANVDNWGTTNDHAVGVFMQKVLVDEAAVSVTAGSNRIGLFPINSSQRLQFYCGAGTSAVTINSIKQGQGLSLYSRTSAAGGFAVGNGLPASWTQAAVAMPAAKPRFFRFLNAYSANEYSFGILGQGLTEAMALSLSDAITELHATLNSLRELEPTEEIGANCFVIPGTPVAPTTRMFRLGRRPTSDAEDFTTFQYGPCTDVHGNISASVIASTDTRINFWRRGWDNRARTAGLKDNGAQDGVFGTFDGVEKSCRFTYTTQDKASGATLICIAQTVGLLARDDTSLTTYGSTYRAAGWGWLDIADYHGYDTSGWLPYLGDPTTLNTNVNVDTGVIAHTAFYNANASIFTEDYLNARSVFNRVCLYNSRIDLVNPSSIRKGVWLDSERKDYLTPTQRKTMLLCASQICVAAGVQIIISTNRKDTALNSGWDADSCTYSLTLPGVAFGNILIPNDPSSALVSASLQTQLNLFKGVDGLGTPNVAKLTVATGLGPDLNLLPVAYAALGRDIIVANNIVGTAITPSFGTQGGELSRQQNQIIATLNGMPTS